MNDIASIDHFNLWSFDLNLLVAFDALMQDRSVTLAASRLKIQQPAMSHNLSTLRALFQDDLFVRVGQVMQPTPRAQSLAIQVRQMLAQAHLTIISNETFDPAKETRTFKIGFSSELEVLLIPELSALLRQIAPNVKILARPANPDQVHRMLDDGVIDLGVGCYSAGGNRHRWEHMFQQSLACCYNAALLSFDEPISQETYLRLDHALVSQQDVIEGCLDDALKKLGVKLNVAMAAPEFLTVLSAVKLSPLLATLPTRIIQRYAGIFGLTQCAVPLTIEVSPIAMVWPARSDKDPALGWIRERIGELIAEVA